MRRSTGSIENPNLTRLRTPYRAALLLVSLSLVVASLFSAEAPARERIEIVCGHRIVRVHPWRCLVTGVAPALGATVYLVHLRWSNWGELKTRARGFVLNQEKGTRSAVKVLLHGKMSCDGETFYRSLRLGYRGHTVLRLSTLLCPAQYEALRDSALAW
jgi:hypothetical protein